MRKMARFVKIDNVRKHENADTLELADVGGWQVVTRIGEFKAGDLAVYFEIDSALPEGVKAFEFLLSKSSRKFEGEFVHVLRTIRLRGEISQGLLLKPEVVFEGIDTTGINFKVDEDVSERLGVKKYEKPLPATMGGEAAGLFPGWIQKTDEERVQNFTGCLSKNYDRVYHVREKIDGSSATFFLDRDGNFGVCSRNLELRPGENIWWEIATAYDIESKMRDLNLLGYAIQGEIYGFGVNGNKYGMNIRDFRVFTIQNNGIRIDLEEFNDIISKMGIQEVPYLGTYSIPYNKYDDVYHDGEGNEILIQKVSIDVKKILSDFDKMKSTINPDRLAEGVVMRDESNTISFKVISNSWLLKYDE